MEVDRTIVMQLAGEAGRDFRTVKTVLQGGGSEPAKAAVKNAAKRLGIVLPAQAPTPKGASAA